jgi:hypothetical protein
LKTADGLGGPLDFSAFCLTIVMRCAIDSKDDNKEFGTVLNLFLTYPGTSLQLALLNLFHNLVILVILMTT